ncbi:GrpB family protein [Bacillus marinisedimentorum]|uniref:GrpB family protein n=1 Tax=Bacillus marinisedimentorum TaxID=1821260 RepID=UPI00087247E3|nr:GrpB family protein [Bacillus marinisedimentorum]
MNKKELGKLYPITVVPYDASWPSIYEKEQEDLVKILGAEIALRIEHIGSTAVPGLSAKPTIDILVEIPEETDIREKIIHVMDQNGYIHMKEQENHLMFVKGYTPAGLDNVSFHIHMGTKTQDFLWERLYFRDFLRGNPSAASEYAKLKRRSAIIYKHDREAYTESKADFVHAVTDLAKELNKTN